MRRNDYCTCLGIGTDRRNLEGRIGRKLRRESKIRKGKMVYRLVDMGKELKVNDCSKGSEETA